MGLYRRKDSQVYWMSFTIDGRMYRRSTETEDRKLAEAIIGKVKTQIVEGKWFDKAVESQITFRELTERYMEIQMRVDLYRVQKLMGHKSTRMTERYAHRCPDSLKSAADALDGYYIHDFFTFKKPDTCSDVEKYFKINIGSV